MPRPALERFRATIRKQGVNPYVDVPERVTRAFALLARAGRVSVVGTLDATPIRATLVPVRGGRHRLYVNGGMRAAAGVGVGDTVRFALRPTSPETVRPPADLAAALRAVAGAKASFDRLAASHRRELLRWIDDARTAASRKRRIQTTVAQVLGKQAPLGTGDPEKPLWTCPKCGNAFVNRNQWHSCRRYDPAQPFVGKPPRIRRLFERFRAMVEACGPVTLLAYRERIAFMVKVRFAGATPKERWLDVGFWLPRRIESPRFRKVETITAGAHIHRLRVLEESDLDSELAGWLREAYDVGCRRHLSRRLDR